MITIDVHPSVLTALQAAFPRPPRSAIKALQKYVNVLQYMLNQARYLGTDPFDAKMKSFTISLHELSNRGGQIGTKRQRVHAWLEENGYSLVSTLVLGSNITGKNSRVKLTDLVTLHDHYDFNRVLANVPQTIASLGEQPSTEEINWINSLYPGLAQLSHHQVQAQYEVIDVNLDSLRVFLEWIVQRKIQMPAQRRNLVYRQALLIYRLGQISDGIFIQEPKPSPFGRTYYHGVSVQNVPKILRAAMLGDAWEYDITSSVIAWKLGYFAMQAKVTCQSIKQTFPWTILYLEDKKSLINDIRQHVFNSSSTRTVDEQTKMIKTALTALGFGARVRSGGWYDNVGQWQEPALASVFKDEDELSRFNSFSSVICFVAEQRELDKFIYNDSLRTQPQLHSLNLLKTLSGRLSKSKVLAYMYQHAETAVMNRVRAELARLNKTVLASIHDAIAVRECLSQDELDTVVYAMRGATGNCYWSLTGREIKAYR